MKYKVIPEEIINNLIEFLDGIQFEASKLRTESDTNKINFCNYMINELLNSADGFEDEADIPEFLYPDEENFLPPDSHKMSDEELDKLMSQFDAFLSGWFKEVNKDINKDINYYNNNIINNKNIYNKNKDKEKIDLKKVIKILKFNNKLSPDQKFEIFYNEYLRQKELDNSVSIDKILRAVKLRLSKGGSDTR